MLRQNNTKEEAQHLNCDYNSTITGHQMNLERSHHYFSTTHHSKSLAASALHMTVVMLLFPFFLLSNAAVLERSSKLYFPTEPRLPSEMEVRIGETLTLTCEASGSPAPKVSWLKNGQPIPEVNSMYSCLCAVIEFTI